MNARLVVISILVLSSYALTDARQKTLQPRLPSTHFHPIRQGFSIKLWMNDWGVLGQFASKNCACIPEVVGCEYPENSYIDHLGTGGIWVGALVDTSRGGIGQYAKRVSTTTHAGGTVPGQRGEGFISEMAPLNPADPWITASILNTADSGAISESDYITAYADTEVAPGLDFHTPIGVEILQRSYAWASSVRSPILPIEYNVVNISPRRLKDVYVGLFYAALPVDLSDTNNATRLSSEGFWPQLRTAYLINPFQPQTTPIGFSIIDLPGRISQAQFHFRWYNIDNEDIPCDFIHHNCDTILYDWLSWAGFPNEGSIRANQSPDNPSITSLLFSLGPVSSWEAGETLKVTIALASGHILEFGPDNLYDNARFAQTLYQRHYNPPVVLPAPRLSIEYGDHKAKIRWSPAASANNPEKYWDDENSVASFYPPDHWRRRNPPPGKTSGGRVFEGYRLYRSEDPAGTANSFTLIKQWDVVDSIGPRYGYDTGIETTYVDSILHTNKTYWYAVTSFGIPDLHVIDYLDFDGVVKKETLNTPSAETSVLASRKRVNLPFAVSQEPDKVLVVPNPYRVDENYTYESGGWEGRAKNWTENKRIIKFIHLPPKCTIRIYSLVGEVITTLYHDDPDRGEIDWNLLSESNRAIASGVYVFSVESDHGTQIGKFAVIR